METWGCLKNIGLDWPLNYDVMAIWLRYFLSQNALKELYRRLIVLKMLQRSEIMPISDSVCTQCLLATGIKRVHISCSGHFFVNKYLHFFIIDNASYLKQLVVIYALHLL